MNLRLRLGLLYLIAFFASIGATLLSVGFFYFTSRLWGWDAKLNLSLAAAMNVVYIVASLSAQKISTQWGRRKALLIIYVLITATCAIAARTHSHVSISGCLLAYMFFIGMTWPMLESLCSQSSDAHEMSRRVGWYNLIWASAGIIALWATGLLIVHWRSGMFVLPLILHGITVLIMLAVLREPAEENVPAAHLEPEPDLLRVRTLALWLSRIALPAMYVTNFALSAILPTLPVIEHFSPALQTFYGSVFTVVRAFCFAILGATAFWHIRPRLLLMASLGLFVAFMLITLAPSQFIEGGAPFWVDLVLMIAGQILLGVAMAMIYTSSLYFGMVLSQGSTEHGGYHEALIGLGGVLGPGAGAITQYFWPHDVKMAVAAVSGIVAMSVIGASGVSIRFRRRPLEVEHPAGL